MIENLSWESRIHFDEGLIEGHRGCAGTDPDEKVFKNFGNIEVLKRFINWKFLFFWKILPVKSKIIKICDLVVGSGESSNSVVF